MIEIRADLFGVKAVLLFIFEWFGFNFVLISDNYKYQKKVLSKVQKAVLPTTTTNQPLIIHSGQIQ